MYAASTETSVVAVSGFGSLVHPGEDASAKEEDDWWRPAEAIVAGTDAAYFSVDLPPFFLFRGFIACLIAFCMHATNLQPGRQPPGAAESDGSDKACHKDSSHYGKITRDDV